MCISGETNRFLLHMTVPRCKVQCMHTDHLLTVALLYMNLKGIYWKQMLLQVVTLRNYVGIQ